MLSILVVEKDNESAELIYEILINEINDLFFVSDGAQALIAFRKYKISLVIVDLEISFVNALDLIHIIKNEKPHTKIIALNSNKNIDTKDNYYIDILIPKDQIDVYLYDSYLKLLNDEKTLKLENIDFNESLENLEIFQRAFEEIN